MYLIVYFFIDYLCLVMYFSFACLLFSHLLLSKHKKGFFPPLRHKTRLSLLLVNSAKPLIMQFQSYLCLSR